MTTHGDMRNVTSLFLVVTGAGSPAGMLTRAGWRALEEGRVFASPGTCAAWSQALAYEQIPLIEKTGSPLELARELIAAAREGSPVCWLAGADGDPGLARAITSELVQGADLQVEVVLGGFDRPGSALLELVEVMDRLRSPGGCPWDAEQTHLSLVPYLLEECYELLEALETGDGEHVCEELGDLLLQVVFHARVAQEDPENPFDIDRVARGISEKLIRRHPHVFGDVTVQGADAVQRNWEQLKAAEKPDREHPTDGIPAALPALARAQKVAGRLDRAGRALPGSRCPDDESDLGDLLLGLAVAAHGKGLDAERALRDAVRRAEGR